MSEISLVLIEWVQETLARRLPQQPQPNSLRWQKLGGDAGFRQYYRLSAAPAMLAVVAPPDTENNQAFVTISRYLRERGLRTPKVIDCDLARGFLLVEDLGEDLLLDHLTDETVDVLYGEALMDLLRLQQLDPDPSDFPPYSRERLHAELKTFDEWFVSALLGYQVTEAERGMLNALYHRLEERALEQRQVIVHRDFHSRNLIYSPGNAPGLIDFQDALCGPLTYDVVSLLRDCYIRWPADRVRSWALAYAGMARDVGLLGEISQEEFLRSFDWMGLQRHIKVLGVFARLSLRDGKHAYLNDLPLVIHYVRSVAGNYPELGEFSRWFDDKLLPLVQGRGWYREVDAA